MSWRIWKGWMNHEDVLTYNFQLLPSDPFGDFKWPVQGLSDLHLGYQKVTGKNLVTTFWVKMMSRVKNRWISQFVLQLALENTTASENPRLFIQHLLPTFHKHRWLSQATATSNDAFTREHRTSSDKKTLIFLASDSRSFKSDGMFHLPLALQRGFGVLFFSKNKPKETY